MKQNETVLTWPTTTINIVWMITGPVVMTERSPESRWGTRHFHRIVPREALDKPSTIVWISVMTSGIFTNTEVWTDCRTNRSKQSEADQVTWLKWENKPPPNQTYLAIQCISSIWAYYTKVYMGPRTYTLYKSLYEICMAINTFIESNFVYLPNRQAIANLWTSLSVAATFSYAVLKPTRNPSTMQWKTVPRNTNWNRTNRETRRKSSLFSFILTQVVWNSYPITDGL